MTRCNKRASCWNLLRKLEILPLASQYIFSLMFFVVNNKNLCIIFRYIQYKCRHANNLYQPSSNFTVYQKGVYCMGIKAYNNLPPYVKEESRNPRKFKIYLLHFLHAHYFYFQYKTSASYRLITIKH
jgi:hypothetical protein